ncbi:arsenate reductase (glutaredoxin) [Gangjinia marincola]|uniref:Arsenate reductase (Glutaredoxin) n=1 Tax=Gangjinia marincola TaxID=578463 RepID=A0ABP3XNP7_9FLAO
MITIYHNPRCRKSREALSLLEGEGKMPLVRLYLKDELSEQELVNLLNRLAIKPIDIIRTTEKIWKEQYKGKDLTDKEVIQAILDNPILMERPIVEAGEKAVIGRPPERVLSILP